MSRSDETIGRGWGVTAVLGWLAFLVLAWWVQHLQPVTALDRTGTALALAARSPTATIAADTITRLGSFPVVDVLAAGGALLLWWRTRRVLLPAALLITVVETGAIVFFAKQLVARSRPPVAELLGAPALDGSFPSGHTTSGAVVWVLGALFLATTLTTRWARTVVVLAGAGVAAAIGATRVYLGYHWSTDVLGGWLLAVAICATAIVFVDRVAAAEQPERLRLSGLVGASRSLQLEAAHVDRPGLPCGGPDAASVAPRPADHTWPASHPGPSPLTSRPAPLR